MQLCIKYSNNALQTINVYLFLFFVDIFLLVFFVETSFATLCFLLCLFAANLWQL